MCGEDCTVGPQTYMPTWPSVSGVKGTTSPTRESYRRTVTASRLWGRPSA